MIHGRELLTVTLVLALCSCKGKPEGGWLEDGTWDVTESYATVWGSDTQLAFGASLAPADGGWLVGAPGSTSVGYVHLIEGPPAVKWDAADEAHTVADEVCWTFGTSVLSVDLDGDGVDELVSGAPGQSKVYGQRMPAERDAEPEGLWIAQPSPDSDLGWNLAEWSGEGGGLIASGDPRYRGSRGAVFFLSPVDGSTAAVLTGTETGDLLGWSLAMVEHPTGTSSLLMGAPGAGVGAAGALYSVEEDVLGESPVVDLASLHVAGTVDGAHLGAAVAAGELDGDGVVDLVVGAPGDGAGVVYIFFGDSTDGWAATTPADADSTITGLGGEFGSVLAVGTLRRGAGDDLAIAAPEQAVEGAVTSATGRVHVFRAGHEALSEGGGSHQAATADVILENRSWPGQLGESLLVTEASGDGSQDLLIGCPWCVLDERSGAVVLVRGLE